MKDLKPVKDAKPQASTRGGAAAVDRLLAALEASPKMAISKSKAVETLYPGDNKSLGQKQHSLASEVTYCFSKRDIKVESFEDAKGFKQLGVRGVRAEGKDGEKGMWIPVQGTHWNP